MGKKHEKLGIKQTIQKVWMDKTVQMLLAGLSEKEIRAELDEDLSTQKQSGGIGERGKKTYGMAISLLAAWFAPEEELISFRDAALDLAGNLRPEDWVPLHWALISASYPFWFNVARQTGRLLNLQDQITQTQIFGRLKEQYGDRESVSRNARYTVRSFIAWGVLRDSGVQGCYEKTAPVSIADANLAILMFESALLATPEATSTLRLLQNNPAFFPFQLPVMTGDFVSQRSERIEVVRYGLDDELLKLNAITTG
jgi:hypothetical protein